MIGSEKKAISFHEYAEVVENTASGEKALYSLRSWLPGQIISPFNAKVIRSAPDYLTVQKSDHEHIVLAPEFLQYINHSCNPNVFFDTTAMQVVCLTPINAGDEFTFFYPSSEWQMQQPFVCNCKYEHCLSLIEGAYTLAPETTKKYRFTDFIQKKLNTTATSVSSSKKTC